MNLAASNKQSPADHPPLKPYTVDAPDILLIDAVKVVPKPPYRIEPLDTLELFVLGTLPDRNIAGPYPVEPDGTIALGPGYGMIDVSGLTITEARDAIKKQLEDVLTAPEVSVSLSESAGQQQIEGEHLIGPDGTVILGSYGSVYVAGMTIPEVRKAIEEHLAQFLDKPRISVDVHAYNSKFYYIVSERKEWITSLAFLARAGNGCWMPCRKIRTCDYRRPAGYGSPVRAPNRQAHDPTGRLAGPVARRIEPDQLLDRAGRPGVRARKIAAEEGSPRSHGAAVLIVK